MDAPGTPSAPPPRWRPDIARELRRALLASLVVHLAVTLAINPAPLLRLFGAKVPLGHPGKPRMGELAPLGEARDGRVSLVRPRQERGLNVVRTVVLGTAHATAGSGPPKTGTSGQLVPSAKPQTSQRSAETSQGSEAEPVRIELDEGWTRSEGSGEVAYSEQFQILKIVRPEYPFAAVEAGVQGLVRLEAQVGVSGEVEEVRVLEGAPATAVLERAAVQAMYQWRFRPYRLNEVVVPFTAVVPFRFRLIG